MKSSKYISRFAALALLLIFIGAVLFYFKKNSDGSNNKSLRVARVEKTSLVQKVTVAGVIEPVRSIMVAAPYDGYIKKIYVKQGQSVRAGDPLVSYAQSLISADNFPIRSPFSGTVVQINRSEGQFVKLNDLKEFSVRVDDLSKRFVVANVPEIEVQKIKPGQEVEIRASAVLQKIYKGIVREASLASIYRDQWAAKAQVEFQAKIEILDSDDLLLSGMSAIVDVITQRRNDILVIGHEFVRQIDNKHYVTLASGKRQMIEIGMQNDTLTEVTKGLSEGQQVVQIDFTQMLQEQE